MTYVEAKDRLKNRVEWRNPLGSNYNFSTPESGRFLQEEHPSVTIHNIKHTMVSVDVTEEVFLSELKRFKEEAILQMLHDVFSEQKEIKDCWIDDYLTLFDYAIILKVSRNIIFGILNSKRTSEFSSITKAQLNKWFVDLNGMKDSESGVFVSSFNKRYLNEIKRIKKTLFKKKSKLIRVTARV